MAAGSQPPAGVPRQRCATERALLPDAPVSMINAQHVKDHLEYYFSDQYLFNDNYLKVFMMPQEGWVHVTLIQTLRGLSLPNADIDTLRQAVATSGALEMDSTGQYVRIKDHRR